MLRGGILFGTVTSLPSAGPGAWPIGIKDFDLCDPLAAVDLCCFGLPDFTLIISTTYDWLPTLKDVQSMLKKR